MKRGRAPRKPGQLQILPAMDANQAEKRILELKDILWENSRRYYVENAPTMSDFEYDTLMHELEDLESRFPQFRTPLPRKLEATLRRLRRSLPARERILLAIHTAIRCFPLATRTALPRSKISSVVPKGNSAGAISHIHAN